jgi:hypothetical protein
MAKRGVVPKALVSALPAASIYAKVKFANAAQQSAAKAKISSDWPGKVGA